MFFIFFNMYSSTKAVVFQIGKDILNDNSPKKGLFS